MLLILQMRVLTDEVNLPLCFLESPITLSLPSVWGKVIRLGDKMTVSLLQFISAVLFIIYISIALFRTTQKLSFNTEYITVH